MSATVTAPKIEGTYGAERAEFLADVLTTAVEGGIGYWSRVSSYRWYSPRYSAGNNGSAEPAPGGHANCWVSVHRMNDAEDGYATEGVVIGLDQIDAALWRVQRALTGDDKLDLGESYKHRITLANLTNDAGVIDANDADIVVQVAVLGDVIFG